MKQFVKLKTFLKILAIWALIFFSKPGEAFAQIVAPDSPAPIPGFRIPSLFAFGPAGQLTATGVILSLISIALWIVGFVAVLFLIVGGFRYITARGNEEQAEDAKRTLTNAIIGIVVVILSFVIIRVIASALILGRFGT